MCVVTVLLNIHFQMALSCDMLGKAESHEDTGGIVIRGAFLQGADWDVEGQCLMLSRWVPSLLITHVTCIVNHR